MDTAILAPAKRRARSQSAIPNLDALPPTAACTTKQVSLLTGYAEVTLQLWRKQKRGPRVTMIEGRPRYLCRDLRDWLGLDASVA